MAVDAELVGRQSGIIERGVDKENAFRKTMLNQSFLQN
jgi:hypothetical protein